MLVIIGVRLCTKKKNRTEASKVMHLHELYFHANFQVLFHFRRCPGVCVLGATQQHLIY